MSTVLSVDSCSLVPARNLNDECSLFDKVTVYLSMDICSELSRPKEVEADLLLHLTHLYQVSIEGGSSTYGGK